jgi:predicted Rossmann-fold nucleotide-binding protein
VVDNSRNYDMAREFGRIVGEANRKTADGQTRIVTGGGPALMEAAKTEARSTLSRDS